MKSLENTMQNIEKYLETKNSAFKRVKSKSSNGYLYKVTSGDVSYTANIKLDEALGFMIFEAYPGVICKHPALAPMLVKYCQSAALEVGTLRVGRMFKEVYFRTEAYFADGEVGEKTVRLFEELAVKAFEKHLPALLSIANGRLVCDAFPMGKSDGYEPSDNTRMFNESVSAIREFLLFRGGFNTVAENIDGASPVMFVAEALDEDEGRMKLEFSVNKSKTVIRVKATPGFENEKCNNEYAYMTSRFCNDKSDEKKLGSFFVDTDGGACCFVDLAISDTPVTVDALQRVYSIIFGMMEEYLSDFRLVSMGIIPESSRLPRLFSPGLRNIGSLIGKRMMDDIDKRMEDIDFRIAEIEDSDDSATESDDSDNNGEFPDFDAFMAEDGTDDE